MADTGDFGRRTKNFIQGLPVFCFINRSEHYAKQSKMENYPRARKLIEKYKIERLY